MSQSSCAESNIEDNKEEVTQEDNLHLRSDNSPNDTIVESKKILKENVDGGNTSSQLSVLTNSSRSLLHESDSKNIKDDEEYSTDSERNAGISYEVEEADFSGKSGEVDETDFSEISNDEKDDGPKESNIKDADKSLGESFSSNKSSGMTLTQASKLISTIENTSSASSLEIKNDLIEDVDVIESSDKEASDNIESFVEFYRKRVLLYSKNKEESETSEQSPVLFSSEEDNYLPQQSAFTQKNVEKIFTRKDSLQNIFMQINEMDKSEILVQEGGFHGFDKNEFGCKTKLCPTKRKNDIEEYFKKCEKEIENMSLNSFDTQHDIPQNNIDKEKSNPLKDSSNENDFLGFDSNEINSSNHAWKKTH